MLVFVELMLFFIFIIFLQNLNTVKLVFKLCLYLWSYWQFQKYALMKMWFVQQNPDHDVIELMSVCDQLQVANSNLKRHEQRIGQEQNQHI